ncbi:hypothetical protein SODALDRAFT_327652, partial [Sodiomyces alkalinus F11]
MDGIHGWGLRIAVGIYKVPGRVPHRTASLSPLRRDLIPKLDYPCFASAQKCISTVASVKEGKKEAAQNKQSGTMVDQYPCKWSTHPSGCNPRNWVEVADAACAECLAKGFP